MTPFDVVQNLATRTLRGTAGYRDLRDPAVAPPQWVHDVSLPNHELLGIYENTPGVLDAAILITRRGLFLERDGAWIAIPYETVQTAALPPQPMPKLEIADVILELEDGKRVVVPVRGRRDRFTDVWQFYSFIRRVPSAVRRQRQ